MTFPKPCYITSGPHLSGYRVTLGYTTLAEMQDAHSFLATTPAEAVAVGTSAASALNPPDAKATEVDREVADLADELIYGGGLQNRGVGVGLVVVEKADKSDPHYRLCDALERRRAMISTAEQGRA